MATRRVRNAGRLAEHPIGLHMVPGVLDVSSVEYGDADSMTEGSIFARVTLDARTQGEWSERSRALLEQETEVAKAGLRLTLAIYRAGRLDRWAESVRWHWSRLFG